MKNIVFYIILLCCTSCWSRIHNWETKGDARKSISLSTFGYFTGGWLHAEITDFRVSLEMKSAIFGFSLDKTINSGMNPFINSRQDQCILENTNGTIMTFFILDFVNNKLKVICPNNNNTHIYKNEDEMNRGSANAPANCSRVLDIARFVKSDHDSNVAYYNASFAMKVHTLEEEGLYNLYFHNCYNYHAKRGNMFVDFRVNITERNPNGYLSAGEIPLPALYCMMSFLFLLSGMFWVFLLTQSRHPVFKIHYMMSVLVFLKAISLAFHGVNYHYIDKLGAHLATWAILYYIAHLLKGALLFVVLVLVGTGWTFIKHVLTPRDKRLFMAVIPLQVLANVAGIILEESEEGAREYDVWRNFVILIDLLCCGCILFPVVWSIRHLQEASQTDGKAAMNLRKLVLFRHYYVMIVCYIYSTRIIVSLLKITVPFQYGWLDEMFREMATYVFFVLTAYKFRPASQNPYFALADDDIEEVLTESGATEGLRKVNSRLTKVPIHQQMLTEVSEEEKEVLLGKESSHEYD